MNKVEQDFYNSIPIEASTHLVILNRSSRPSEWRLKNKHEVLADHIMGCRDSRGGQIRSIIAKKIIVEFARRFSDVYIDPNCEFFNSASGKPYWRIEGLDCLEFSISYSFDFVAVAICPLGAVGCDIELNRRIENCERLAVRLFPDLLESDRVSNLVEIGNQVFLERWCLLESFAKCGGEGLAHWLGRVRFDEASFETRLARSCSMHFLNGLVASITWADPEMMRRPLVVWNCELDDQDDLAFVPQVRLPVDDNSERHVIVPGSFRFWLPSSLF